MTWESPAVRSVIYLRESAVERTRNLRLQVLRKSRQCRSIEIRYNEDPDRLLRALADPELKANTWVGEDALDMYVDLLRMGRLVSVEAYEDQDFIGGVLCVNLGPVLAIETMITIRSDASKLCLFDLVPEAFKKGVSALDCQGLHPAQHPLARIGEILVERADYLALLKKDCDTSALWRGTMTPWARN